MAKEVTQQPGKLVIAILDRGWVFVGRADVTDNTGSVVRIANAACIRRWGTSKGVGQLAIEGKQKETVLDEAGTVTVPLSSVVAMIDAVESVWPGR